MHISQFFIYLIVFYIALIVMMVFTYIVHFLTKVHQQTESSLGLMKGRIASKNSLIYRDIRTMPVLTFHIQVGRSSYPIKTSYKVHYLSGVMDCTIFFILGLPISHIICTN